MKFCAAIGFSAFLVATTFTTIAFTPKNFFARENHGCSSFSFSFSSSSSSSTKLKIVVGDTAEEFEARVDATFEKATPKDPGLEAIVQGHFEGAISNQDLVTTTVRLLASKGYNGENTLLATSLCCDELARQLEDDLNGIYGKNFNLGGLAGFPFAGKTGFGAMAAHIPDDGYCLLVYGPQVGVSADGTVGKVERSGIALVDTCCGSAVAASEYVDAIMSGTKDVSTSIQTFLDFQQQMVQELLLPHGKRLADAENRMIELPYALYDSQDALMTELVQTLSTSIKRGLSMLGGIQIITGPDSPDYFVPLKFHSVNYRGEIIDDMLDDLKGKAGGDLNSIAVRSNNEENDQAEENATIDEERNEIYDPEEDKPESNTESDRIQESTNTTAKSGIISGETVGDDGEGDGGNGGDFNTSGSDNGEQSNNIIRTSMDTAKVVAERDKIIIAKGDGDRDKIDTDKHRSNNITVSTEESEKILSPNDIDETKMEKIRDVSKSIQVNDLARTDNITEKMGDSSGDCDGSENDKQRKATVKIEDTVENVSRSDTIMYKADLDVNVIGNKEKQRDTKPRRTKDTSVNSSSSSNDNQENTKPNTSKVVAPSIEHADAEEEDDEHHAEYGKVEVAKTRNPVKNTTRTDLKINMEGNDNRSVSGSAIESSNKGISSSIAQNESVPKEDHLGEFGKENDENSQIGNTSQTIAPSDMEAQNESSSKRDRIMKGVKDAKTLSVSDGKITTEISISNTSIGTGENGYFFTKKDGSEKHIVEAESEGADLLLDEDHLSWLTTPESQAVKNRNETLGSKVEEEQIKNGGDDTLTADSIQRGDGGYDEDNIDVGDTYLLGKQIASALENANVDIVGVDDGEIIAPALADALLFNIERDAYDRMNEGWNQFGAKSLYSIGEDETDDFVDDFEPDTFTDELLQQIAIETSSASGENDSDSQHCDGEELVLVADSILDIINHNEDEYGGEPNTEKLILDTDKDADAVDEDDEPPIFHRYVLKPDNTG